MKKTISVVLGICIGFVFSGCNKKEDINQNIGDVYVSERCDIGEFFLENDVYKNEDGNTANEKTTDVIKKAKDVIVTAGYGDTDFSRVYVNYENDPVSKKDLCVVKANKDEKSLSVFFGENNNLVRFSSGFKYYDAEAIYTAEKTDDVIELAQKYYNLLDVPQNYVVSEWQMDFGGYDWQIEFSKKIDVAGYDKDVYNYGEMVRMRISAADGKLLSVNVFSKPLKMYDTDTNAFSHEDALNVSKLDKDKIVKQYIGCYSPKDTDYARLCWCFEADYSQEYGTCDTRWVYVDLYTGEILGEEHCG